MRRLPQQISLLAVSVFTIGAVAVAPVSARAATEDSTNTAVTTESDDSTSTSTSSTGTGTTQKHSDGHQIASVAPESRTQNQTAGDEKDLQEQAHKLLQEKRQNGKEKSVEARQKACDAHKAELTTRSENYARNGQKHLEVFNKIYDEVVAFQEKKQLSVSNYNDLKAAVDAKKAAATTAVADLSSSDVTIDCTSQDPAANLAVLKTTVANARQALQDYRVAIKNLVVALQTAKDNTTATTDTKTSTETNQ